MYDLTPTIEWRLSLALYVRFPGRLDLLESLSKLTLLTEAGSIFNFVPGAPRSREEDSFDRGGQICRKPVGRRDPS